VNLYPNPTAPLLHLYPKSPERKTGSGEISPALILRVCKKIKAKSLTVY
jgi:hypothetical protein